MFFLFGIWGLITSLALDPTSVRARKSAIVWHTIFVAIVAWAFTGSNPSHSNPAEWIVLLWGAAGLAAVFYLASEPGYQTSGSD